jgi:hypothetical protein
MFYLGVKNVMLITTTVPILGKTRNMPYFNFKLILTRYHFPFNIPKLHKLPTSLYFVKKFERQSRNHFT